MVLLPAAAQASWGAGECQADGLTATPCPPQCAYLQAKNCQVESKYLAGLQRLQEAAEGECAELLRQLIQEALQCEAREALAEGVELSPVR